LTSETATPNAAMAIGFSPNTRRRNIRSSITGKAEIRHQYLIQQFGDSRNYITLRKTYLHGIRKESLCIGGLFSYSYGRFEDTKKILSEDISFLTGILASQFPF
jgi:hypothetical protein